MQLSPAESTTLNFTRHLCCTDWTFSRRVNVLTLFMKEQHCSLRPPQGPCLPPCLWPSYSNAFFLYSFFPQREQFTVFTRHVRKHRELKRSYRRTFICSMPIYVQYDWSILSSSVLSVIWILLNPFIPFTPRNPLMPSESEVLASLWDLIFITHKIWPCDIRLNEKEGDSNDDLPCWALLISLNLSLCLCCMLLPRA